MMLTVLLVFIKKYKKKKMETCANPAKDNNNLNVQFAFK